ncbi:MAG: ABC transporter ATP-binding protein [Sphaerochaetaceae bacterium]|nr:ABC transporter ATP-binding protein [Sphaerochaetaceae bacterium]
MNAVSIKNLSGGYEEHKVLENINLDLFANRFTAITGPNGCGKSTLLKHIIRELIPTCGSISVFGTDIKDLSQIELARIVSFVSQKSDFASDFTVEDIVSLGRYCHFDEKSSSEVIKKSMELVGIENLKSRKLGTLSGGEYQLAMIARALCQDTRILLLDEITNNLDPRHELQILRLLRHLADSEGKTVIAVMHNLSDVLSFCDETVILKDGRLFACGKTEETLTESNIESVFEIKARIIREGDLRLLTVY